MKTAARQQELLRGLNSLARKVFEATPINIPWSVSEIRQELVRQGSHHDVRAIEGSLRNMYESGLVYYDNVTRKFRREPVRQESGPVLVAATPRTEIAPPAIPIREIKTMTAQPQKSPLDIILDLSERVKTLVKDAQKLQSDLDDAGIALQQAFATESAKSEQLKALKALLRD